MIERTILIELKAIKALDTAHTAQCLNHPKATGHHLRLLLNFGKPRRNVHRMAHCPQNRSVYPRVSAYICG